MSNFNPQFDQNEDLGEPARRWRKFYGVEIVAKGDVDVGGALEVTGAATVGGALEVTGAATLNGDVVVSLPTSNPALAGQLWSDSGFVKMSAG
jgi:hypothetical protein